MPAAPPPWLWNDDRAAEQAVAANKAVASKRLVNDATTNRKATVKRRRSPANILLRYWNGDGQVVLAERNLIVA